MSADATDVLACHQIIRDEDIRPTTIQKRNQEMKLSKNEAAVLSLLIDEGEMYGLEMVKKSGGQLKLGTIYVTLSRMEERGFATSRREQEPTLVVPRRLYTITGTGARVYRAWTDAEAYFNSRLCGVEHG
jgi:DNA-binding PadR family transcriptional regulator